MKKILFILAIFISSTALAGNPGPIDSGPVASGITAADLSASPSFTVAVGGYYTLAVYVYFTHSAATDVKMTCYSGPDATPTTVMTGSSALSAMGDTELAWSHAVTGDKDFRWEVGLKDEYTKCTLSGTSADSSDLVTVKLRRAAR